MTQPAVEAAVGVILREDGQVLLGQRPPGKTWAGWWEFPGGKIEEGESPLEALQRELHEEIGIEAEQVYPWITRIFSYPERKVVLRFFMVRRWHREPHGRENQLLSWQDPAAVTVSPLLPANAPVMTALCLPPVHAITNLAEMGEAPFLSALERALQNGLRLVQVREKQLDRDALVRFAATVVALARPYGARVVVNGDAGIARASGADGFHLSSAALMSLDSKPEGLLCGASCHDRAELQHAATLHVDYVLLGPVQATLTHPGAAVLGWSRFAALIPELPMPVYALGGLGPQDMADAWRHGAHGLAMQRGAW